MWVTSTAKALTPTTVALGNFDGLHRGHQQVIQPILEQVSTACTATVVTFNPHPIEFFSGQSRALLTPLHEKVQLLLGLGVQQLVLLPFDRELAALTPQQFVEEILVQQLRSKWISVGEDFRFGWKRTGTATNLQAIAANFGIPVTIVPLYTSEGERISSSSIRQALEQGDIQSAEMLLGRSYTLTGSVVKGQQLGRTIDFPTANLQLPAEKFLPRQGVYAVQVFLEEDKKERDRGPHLTGIRGEGNSGAPSYGNKGQGELSSILSPSSDRIQGVMNIGSRPTVNGTYPSVEVHLLDWSGDLYGRTLTVHLQRFLRPEEKFASLEALKAQIQADCATARSVLCLEL